MLRGKLVDMFYGIEGDKYFYYVCSECGSLMTVEESTSVRAAAASSEECSHTSGTWHTVRKATDNELGLEVLVCDLCEKYIEARLILHNKEYRPGDINNDGTVNNKDLTRLFQYLSDWDVEVDGMTLDINGDGKVNNKDIIRLFRYLSNWDVEMY